MAVKVTPHKRKTRLSTKKEPSEPRIGKRAERRSRQAYALTRGRLSACPAPRAMTQPAPEAP